MKIRCWILVLLGVLGLATDARAEGGLLHHIFRDTVELQRWPQPYACWDNQAARACYPIMIQNGWRRQNLLADHDFNADGNALSPAGEHKVRWILTQAPLQHRTIFVRKAETADQTATRIAAVRDYAAKVAPDGGPASILETHLNPLDYPVGWPGSKDTSLLRKFQSSMTGSPYLPDRGSGTTQ